VFRSILLLLCHLKINSKFLFQLAVLQEYPKDKIAGRITDFYNHCSSKNVSKYLVLNIKNSKNIIHGIRIRRKPKRYNILLYA